MKIAVMREQAVVSEFVAFSISEVEGEQLHQSAVMDGTFDLPVPMSGYTISPMRRKYPPVPLTRKEIGCAVPVEI